MDRTDRVGLGAALLLHIGLLGALSVSLLSRTAPTVPPPPAVDVSLVEEIGLQSSAPKPVAEPAPSQAPDPGPPEDTAPPPPQPQPAEPKPPEPKPAEPKPKPAPVAVAKPAPPKPRDVATAAPAKPVKPAAKPAPAPAVPAKPAAKPGTGTQVAAVKPRPRGSRLSDDIVAGLTDKPSPSKVVAPVGVVIDARALAGIQDAIRRQIQPCADRQVNPGPGANDIVTTLNLRLNPDGTLAADPSVVRQAGLDESNSRYARRVIDLGIAAFKACTPLRLPSEYYQTANGGWSNINYNWQLR